MSEDGKRVAFLANPDRVFRDFEEVACYGTGKPWSSQVSWPMSLSADGSVHAYVLGDADGQRVLFNGVPGPRWPRIQNPVALSRNGRTFAYKVVDKDAEFIVGPAGRGPAFDGTSLPAVSADGSTIAYLADSDEGARLIVNGQARPVSSSKGTLILSEDGRRWFRFPHPGQHGRLEQEGKVWEEDLDISWASFSPDGHRLLYAGRDSDNELVIVVDQVRHPAPGLAGPPVWSFDGSRIYYPAWRGGKLVVGELR